VVRGDDGFTISMVAGATGNELGGEGLSVPARVTKYHPVAGEFRDRTSIHEVSRNAFRGPCGLCARSRTTLSGEVGRLSCV
jgi:hypothetical protein